MWCAAVGACRTVEAPLVMTSGRVEKLCSFRPMPRAMPLTSSRAVERCSFYDTEGEAPSGREAVGGVLVLGACKSGGEAHEGRRGRSTFAERRLALLAVESPVVLDTARRCVVGPLCRGCRWLRGGW